eukprot:6128228-Amphidinium_carterae.1
MDTPTVLQINWHLNRSSKGNWKHLAYFESFDLFRHLSLPTPLGFVGLHSIHLLLAFQMPAQQQAQGMMPQQGHP